MRTEPFFVPFNKDSPLNVTDQTEWEDNRSCMDKQKTETAQQLEAMEKAANTGHEAQD